MVCKPERKAPGKTRVQGSRKDAYIYSAMLISLPNPMLDHRSNIGFGEVMQQIESIEVNFKHIIWDSGVFIYPLDHTSKATLLLFILSRIF